MIDQLDKEFSVCAVVRHEYPDLNPQSNRIVSKLAHPIKAIQHLYARFKLAEHDKRAQDYINATFKTENIDRENTPELFTDDVNEQAVVDFIKQHSPDIICVNGTNLLKNHLLDQIADIPYGIINLHTGLSPYSRGGNCNLYMLLEKQPQLVGITVHHIDKGIDSGDIIISAQVEYDEDDNYEIIDAKCFKLGIDAMLEACRRLFCGSADRVKQWEKGKLFLNRTGYSYRPYHRLQVNSLISRGLVRDYLKHKAEVDQRVKTVGDFRVC